jgi:hypothetical protein
MKTALQKIIEKANREELEDRLAFQIKAVGLPTPFRQYKFHPQRDWRFDFCWPQDSQLAVEVDGGTWMKKSGHQTGMGYTNDRIRDAEAMCRNWVVLRVTGDMVKDGTAIKYIEKLFPVFGANE